MLAGYFHTCILSCKAVCGIFAVHKYTVARGNTKKYDALPVGKILNNDENNNT